MARLRRWLPRVAVFNSYTACPWTDEDGDGRQLVIRWGSLLFEIGLHRVRERGL